MGFSFLHRYIFNDQVIYPIQNHIKDSNKTSRIYIDCTGLLYQISYSVPTSVIENDVNILLDTMAEHLFYFVNIVRQLTSNSISVYLFFDGKSPKHKMHLQKKRDEKNKKMLINNKKQFGLSLLTDRNKRNLIISHIANNISSKLYNLNCKDIFLSSTDLMGEADIKIIKTILNLEPNESILEVIVTADTDIFISMNSLRKRNVFVIVKLPHIGLQCLTAQSLNNWLNSNAISYKKLLFYFIFFCGNDYECPIISGTKKQILYIYEYGKKCGFKVTIFNLLSLWSMLNIKPIKSVVIKGLSLNVLCKIVQFKINSTKQSMKYYSFGYNLPNNHVTLLPIFNKWKILIKNINPKIISEQLRQIHHCKT